MLRRHIAQAVATSVVAAVVIVGGWSARPQAKDDYSPQHSATEGSEGHPHGAPGEDQ